MEAKQNEPFQVFGALGGTQQSICLLACQPFVSGFRSVRQDNDRHRGQGAVFAMPVIYCGSQCFQITARGCWRLRLGIGAAVAGGNVRQALIAPPLVQGLDVVRHVLGGRGVWQMLRSVGQENVRYQWFWSTLRSVLLPEIRGKPAFSPVTV